MSVEQSLADFVRRIVREEISAMPTTNGPTVLTTTQAAELTGRSPKTIRSWITRGLLRATPNGRFYAIQRTDLDEYLSGKRHHRSHVRGSAEDIVQSLRRS